MAVTSFCALFVVLLNFCCLSTLAGPISEGLAESLMKVLEIPGGGGGGRIRGSPSQYMLELYSDVTAGPPSTRIDTPYGASTITAVTVTESKGDTFFFLPPNISKSEELLEVEFHLYHGHLRDPRHHNDARARRALYKVEASVRGSTDTYTQLISGTGGGWLRFRIGRSGVLSELERQRSNSNVDDINAMNHNDSSTNNTTQSGEYKMAHSINSNRRSQKGFIAISVEATAEDGRPVRMKLHHARKSILVFFTKSLFRSDQLPLHEQNDSESSHHRVRRSLLAASAPTNSSVGQPFNSSQNSGETHSCERQPLMIDFREIGWAEWIIAPAGFNAYFCSGSCGFPLGQHQNPTNHAILMSLVRVLAGDGTPSEPHCVPSSYTGLLLLYVDSSSNIVLKNYKDMVVQSCGCR